MPYWGMRFLKGAEIQKNDALKFTVKIIFVYSLSLCFTPVLENWRKIKLAGRYNLLNRKVAAAGQSVVLKRYIGQARQTKVCHSAPEPIIIRLIDFGLLALRLGLLFGQQHLAHVPHFASLQNRKIHAARQFSRVESDMINPAFLPAVD